MHGGVTDFRSNHKITSLGDPELSGQTYWEEFDIHHRKYCFECFSMFFIQSPSFLAYQRTMKKAEGESNAETLLKNQWIWSVIGLIEDTIMTGNAFREQKFE